MFPRINGVRHLRDYWLEIHFTDDTTAELDFRTRIVGRGGVFRALQEVHFFKQAAVDQEAGTLVWPNGVDFCPDVLYAEATGRSIEEMDTSMMKGA
jgi:hypothetical protein